MRNRINWWIPYGILLYENGFYLFAEYANMFISSTILAVLFFGGYNYPGMSWAVETVNLANVGIVALFIKNMRLHFPLHVGEMDYPKI
jgi:NADH:ubiquinone oxidoreductase subunit H